MGVAVLLLLLLRHRSFDRGGAIHSLDDFPSNPLWRILPRHGETCDATHTELNVTKTVQSFLIQWFVLGDSKPRQATIYITPTFTS